MRGTGALRRTAASCVAVVAVMLLATGCGDDAATEAGFGLGELSREDAAAVLSAAGAEAVAMSGELVARNDGCFAWSSSGPADGAWIVWPESAALDEDDGGRVRLEGGETVADGSAVTVTAAVVALDDLPAGSNRDSYFGSFGRFCDAQESGVLVVLDAVAR